jgi:large subunit ribosomal protein L9
MALVQLILSEDVNRLGHAGDLVSVKPGFARNYLVPEGKATLATESKIKELEHHKRVIADKLAKELKDHEAVAHKLRSIKLEVARRAGEDGKLFGSVTSQNVADLLAEKGLVIDRRKIQMSDAIKEVGDHKIEVKLHRGVSAEVALVVSIEE